MPETLKERAPPPPPPLSDMPAILKEREGAKLTARGNTSLTPRAVAMVLPAVATLVAANDVKQKGICPSGSEPPPTSSGKEEQAEEKPNEKKPDDDGKGGGKGGRKGGPVLPDEDEPGPPDPTSNASRIPSIYQNLTMTEAGRLIEE